MNHSVLSKHSMDEEVRMMGDDRKSELRETLADRVSQAAKTQVKLRSQAAISNRDGNKVRRKLNLRLN